jgi:hypothetical protein
VSLGGALLFGFSMVCIGGVVGLALGLGASALLAAGLAWRTCRAVVTVHADGLVTVRNPFMTWTARSGHAFSLGGWSNQRMPWLDDRYLSLVWTYEDGRARTIRLWAVGPDEADRLVAALGLRVAEPHSNVRQVPPSDPNVTA